jgi:aquaglyceroporin related protein, other eukaryote
LFDPRQITVQYTLGFSANLSMTVSRGAAGVNDTGTWAWGLSTMLAIYVAGGISGAHLNPAISLMLYIYRGFPLNKIPSYIGAQLLGAVLATLISFSIFRGGLLALLQEGQHSLGIQGTSIPNQHGIPHANQGVALPPSHTLMVLSNFLTFPRAPWVSASTAFTVEMTATSLLVISVLALGDDTNAPPGAGMNAFIVGLLITILGMSFGSLTGLAMNPIRDFGPRLVMLLLGYGTPASLFGDGYWFKVAWLGPILGAILGGFLYDAAIFVGGESPVNYPGRRIRRAARKWRKRWRVRMGWKPTSRGGKGQK